MVNVLDNGSCTEGDLFSEAQCFIWAGRVLGLDAWPMLPTQCPFSIIIITHCFLGYEGGVQAAGRLGVTSLLQEEFLPRLFFVASTSIKP